MAFSRILVDREVTIVANTSASNGFSGHVLLDRDLNPAGRTMKVAYSNRGTTGAGTVKQISNARFFDGGMVTTGTAAALPIVLKTSEVQILVPA